MNEYMLIQLKRLVLPRAYFKRSFCLSPFLVLLLPIVLWLQSSPALGGQIRYNVENLDHDLKNNVELFLEALPDIKPHQLPRYRNNIITSVTEALEALGYYSGKVKLELDDSKKNTLNIMVNKGEPVRYRNIDIKLEGDAKQNRRFKKTLKNTELKPGEILNHGTYEAFKDQLSNLAQAQGFFDARFVQHSVSVYPSLYAADLSITFDSGKRYLFGEVRFGPISEGFKALVQKMITIRPGKPYKTLKLGALNKDLSSTNYFQSIRIEPQRNDIVDYRVPILITVTPNPNHQIETGIGFSTDEGPRASLNWNKPVINNKGHSLSNKLLLSENRAEVSSSYKIPYGNPLLEYYNLQTGYQYKELEDTKSNLITAAAHKWKKNPKGWDRDSFFRIQYESYRQGIQEDNNLMNIPGMTLTRRRANGELDPKHGYMQTITLEGTSHTIGSDASFIKLWGRTKWLTTLAKKHRFIARVDQGIIWIDDIASIPPSIRFFTGGDQTVRGYDYESISPTDKEGKLTGGQYMTAASIEYNYQFAEHWRVATFVDSGTATNNYDEPWKTGTGIGIRWISPLGPLRLDLAFAISEKGSPFRLHFSVGPEL